MSVADRLAQLEERTPTLAAKLRNLPPEQLTQLLTTKEPTK